jgi:hypothetical protein
MQDVTSRFLRKPRLQRLLTALGVTIEAIETSPYSLDAITWEESDNSRGWRIKLYPDLAHDGPATPAVALAIADISHRTNPLYIETPPAEFNRLSSAYVESRGLGEPEAERCKAILVTVDAVVGRCVALDYLLRESYLTARELRDFVSYFRGRILGLRSTLEVLGAHAVLRAGSRGEVIDRILSSNRAYELLVLVDRLENVIASRRVRHVDVVEIYEALGTVDSVPERIPERISLLQAMTLGQARQRAAAYDVAISHADQDQAIAERLAELLIERQYRVFLHKFERANLWGKDLYEHLADIYLNRSRYCLVLISQHYFSDRRQKHELLSAQARSYGMEHEYVLPLRLDDTDIPAILPTTGSIDLRLTAFEDVVTLVVDKLES